jgi:hypothetical protein
MDGYERPVAALHRGCWFSLAEVSGLWLQKYNLIPSLFASWQGPLAHSTTSYHLWRLLSFGLTPADSCCSSRIPLSRLGNTAFTRYGPPNSFLLFSLLFILLKPYRFSRERQLKKSRLI